MEVPLLYTITYDGLWARINRPLPEALENELRDSFLWVNALDFNDVIPYYHGGGLMLGGVVNTIAKKMREAGLLVKVDLPHLEPTYSWKLLWDYRPLQEEVVLAAYKARRGVIQATTGFGKTLIFCALTCMVGLRTIIVVQNEKPFSQAYDRLVEATTIPEAHVGRVGDGHKKIGAVTVMMIQSIAQELKDNPDGEVARAVREAEVVIVDEGHHGVSDSYQTLLGALGSPYYILNFSATPWRDDERHELLSAYYGDILCNVTYGEAIEADVSCPMTVIVEKVPKKDYPKPEKQMVMRYDAIEGKEVLVERVVPTWQETKVKRDRYRMVYDDYIVNNPVRNAMGVKFARDAISKKKTCAIIVGRIDHAFNIKALMPEAHVVTSKTKPKERDDLFEKLQNHEIMAVITTLMDEAVDIPSLDCVALMAGGKSSSKLVQRLRCTRKFSGQISMGWYDKKRGYVYYPIDNCEFLSYHSSQLSGQLRGVVAQSPLNKYIKIG